MNPKKIVIFISILSITSIVIWKADYFSEKNIIDQSLSSSQIANGMPTGSAQSNINRVPEKDISKKAIKLSIAKLNKQLTSLQSQINHLKNQGISNIEDTTLPELTPEEEAEIATQAIQQEVDLIDDTLDSETVDLAWSQEAHGVLTEAIQNNDRMTGVQLDAVECKSTLCRLSLSFDDQSSLDNGFRTMPSIMPWEGQAFFRVDDMESGEAVVYLAREGYELPNSIN